VDRKHIFLLYSCPIANYPGWLITYWPSTCTYLPTYLPSSHKCLYYLSEWCSVCDPQKKKEFLASKILLFTIFVSKPHPYKLKLWLQTCGETTNSNPPGRIKVSGQSAKGVIRRVPRTNQTRSSQSTAGVRFCHSFYQPHQHRVKKCFWAKNHFAEPNCSMFWLFFIQFEGRSLSSQAPKKTHRMAKRALALLLQDIIVSICVTRTCWILEYWSRLVFRGLNNK
jgi:hypothetical protein